MINVAIASRRERIGKINSGFEVESSRNPQDMFDLLEKTRSSKKLAKFIIDINDTVTSSLRKNRDSRIWVPTHIRAITGEVNDIYVPERGLMIVATDDGATVRFGAMCLGINSSNFALAASSEHGSHLTVAQEGKDPLILIESKLSRL